MASPFPYIRCSTHWFYSNLDQIAQFPVRIASFRQNKSMRKWLVMDNRGKTTDWYRQTNSICCCFLGSIVFFLVWSFHLMFFFWRIEQRFNGYDYNLTNCAQSLCEKCVEITYRRVARTGSTAKLKSLNHHLNFTSSQFSKIKQNDYDVWGERAISFPANWKKKGFWLQIKFIICHLYLKLHSDYISYFQTKK